MGNYISFKSFSGMVSEPYNPIALAPFGSQFIVIQRLMEHFCKRKSTNMTTILLISHIRKQ